MAYERCVHKKLRSLFEYLDTDGDGRITPSNLQNGINRLNSITFNNDEKSMNKTDNDSRDSSEILQAKKAPVICEYEVEELLRCIPK